MKSSKRLDGFTLVEISIVLLIIGIITAAMLKGQDIITNAQIRAVASDVSQIRLAYSSYVNTYDALPGDDSNASLKFVGVENGDGDGYTSASDASKIFQHLYKSGLISSPTFKTPKIGGSYRIVSSGQKPFISISDNRRGSLTAKQATLLKAKIISECGISNGDAFIEPEIANMESSEKAYSIQVTLD